ncbi:MAG: hypothetical protein M3235_15105 [Actinomycetota bacterium]|nr:hypothetical protein [Actinomycetota bacterium]
MQQRSDLLESTAPAATATSIGLEVRFTRIDVLEISDPGSEAEARFTLTANGQSQSFVDDNLGRGTTAINRSVLVTTAGSLSVRVTGIENDTTSGDDVLPGFTRTFSPAADGVGTHRVRASNEHMTYDMHIEIRRSDALATKLNGTATLTTSSSRAPGPFTVPVSIGLVFNGARTAVSVSSFPDITVQTDNGPVVVSRIAGGNGTFTKSTGAMQLSVTLLFDLPFPAGDSKLPITLTTGTAGSLTGRPLDGATRRVRLVGAGKFVDGFLDNETATLVVDGTLEQLP